MNNGLICYQITTLGSFAASFAVRLFSSRGVRFFSEICSSDIVALLPRNTAVQAKCMCYAIILSVHCTHS